MTKLKKILMVFSTIFIVFGLAENSTKITFTGITKGKLLDEDSKTASFVDKGKTLDTLNVEFTGKIDNVEGYVKLSGGTVAETAGVLKFSSAYLKVNDLFDGLLGVKFFDIGNGAGKANSILIDKGVRGVYLTVKPIDLLTVGLGYGINNYNFNNEGGLSSTITKTNKADNSTTKSKSYSIDIDKQRHYFSVKAKGNGDYHNLKLALGVNLDILPFTLYFGTAIADRKHSINVTSVGVQNILNAISSSSVSAPALPAPINSKESKIALMQGGLSADLLAVLKPGALKLDVGASFMGYATYDVVKTANREIKKVSEGGKFDPTKPIDPETGLDLVTILHGGVTGLGLEELGLDYYFHYALDTSTKHNTLGDVDDDFFAENIKISVTPSYTLGQFKFGLGIGFKRYGEVAALQYKGYLDKKTGKGVAHNALDLDPSVTWTPASGMSVKLFYNMDMTLNGDNIYFNQVTLKDQKIDLEHTIGMQASVSFGVSSEEE